MVKMHGTAGTGNPQKVLEDGKCKRSKLERITGS